MPDFIILAVKSFTSKVPITPRGYHCNPFMNLADVSILRFMKNLVEIDNEYSKPFLLITMRFTLVAIPLTFLFIQQKCDRGYNQCITRFKRKSPQECSEIDMVPIASGTKTDLKAKFQKVLEEKGIDPRAYEMYINRKYSNVSFNVL